MKLLYEGKTKNVFGLDEQHVLLKFKDDATGKDGVFDPGANTVGLTIPGSGKNNVKLTTYFFEKFKEENIPTHYVSANIEEATLTVKKATMLGRGVEVIVRYRAVGSFLRRYGDYCEEHDELGGIIEFTLKDDKREDPPITKDVLVALRIVAEEELERIITITKKVADIVKDEFKQRDLELYDIKFEFGRDPETGEILLIDEISAGNMRVYQGKEPIDPTKLTELFFK